MIMHGMVSEGVEMVKAVRERYDGERRNPWNEIECGGHYARAMSNWSLLLALSGFTYDGPKGIMGVAPVFKPDSFKSVFTAAEGWGVFEQQRKGTGQQEKIALKWGKLPLRRMIFALSQNAKPAAVEVRVAGKVIKATHAIEGSRLSISLPSGITLQAGQTLEVSIRI